MPGKKTAVNEDGGVDVSCGYGSCKPTYLQIFNNPKFMLFVLCFLVTSQGFVVNGVFNVNVTSLERQFHLKSSELGFVAGSYDLSAAFFGIFISYLGSGRGKPKWLTMASVAMAIASLLMVLPHFTAGKYEWGEKRTSTCNVDGGTEDSESTELCSTSNLRKYVWLFAAGMVVYGIGGAALYTVGTGYIDDSVTAVYSPVFLGFFFGFAALGPGLGYLVGGVLLRLYVDFDTLGNASVELSQTDPRYVGAWWVGHFIALGCFVLAAVPLSCFGTEMPTAEEVRRTRVSQLHKGIFTDDVFGKPERPPIRSLPQIVVELLKNPPFLFTTLGGVCDFFIGSGVSTFLPKFLQNNFHVSSSQAGIYSGIVIVLGLAGGILCGGLVCRCFKLKVRGMLRFCVGASAVGLLFTPLFWAKCDPPEFAGLDVPYIGSGSTISLMDTCNKDCGCTFEFYEPVCSNGIQYFSPCIAGCLDSSTQDKTFANCTCVPKPSNETVSMVSPGFCSSSCSQLYIVLPLMFLFTFATISADVPAEQAVLRSIDQNHRVISLGFNRFIIRILGSFIGPIVYGAVTDSACSIWQTECGDKTSCWVYDNFTIRRNYFIIAIVMKTFSVLSFLLASVLYQPPKQHAVSKSSATEGNDGTFTNISFVSEKL